MKRITLLVFAMTMGFLGLNQEVNGQTKVFDQTITWTHPPYDYGGYGFYWWHRTDGGVSHINYGDMPSDNWLSPNNYYNGEFTMSVEVVSQPTNDPFWIQFGIWGDYSKGSLHTETVAARQWVNGGAGSTGSWSLGSPSGWWQKQPSDPLDFSRAGDFYRIGVVLWNTDPVCIPMGLEWNTSGCPEYGDRFFPLTIRIRVFASSGVYVPPVSPPNYSVDYANERTNKVVSTEDQYSFNSNFSPVVDGNGQFLSLTPGTNVYFRKKSDPSKTQTLTVKNRPAAPSFGIDYPNERTSTTVNSEYRYSSNSDMSEATNGDGSHVYLTPGANKYFQKRATSSDFTSNKQTLTVPGRPAAPSFGIDYPNERTSTVVSSDYQYSSNSDMSGAVNGDGSHVYLTPGSNKYFRQRATSSAFASTEQELIVPARPDAPSFAIDYINERTGATVSSSYQHSASSDMNGAITGDGSYVSLTPGLNWYFRKIASASAFASTIQELVVPDKPAAPSFTIDFINERTGEAVSNEYQHSDQSDMSAPSNGNGSQVNLTPGSNKYFRKKASGTSFISEIQTLVSPARPPLPSVGINYGSVTTDRAIGPDLQYSTSSGFESASGGTGAALSVVPGTDLYFRTTPTASAFSSEVFHLRVPGNPVVASMESGSTALYPFIVSFTFSQEIAALDVANLTVLNAEIKNMGLTSAGSGQTVFEGLVYATAKDNISISVPVDATMEGNFSSNTFLINYNGQLPDVGIGSNKLNSFAVYPNPGKGVFFMKFEKFDSQATYKVECCSITGEVVHRETFWGMEDLRMDLSDLSDGFYLLRITENDKLCGVVKLIVK